MPKIKPKPELELRINVNLGELRRTVMGRCKELGITLEEAARQAFTLWLKKKQEKRNADYERRNESARS